MQEQDFSSIPETENTGFIIDSDSKADWAIRKIKEYEMERDRFITFYKDQTKKAETECDINISRLMQLLIAYFETVPHHKTKTQESYKLPSGKLQLTYEKEKLETTDELLPFLKDNNMTEYIRTKEEPAWDVLKPTLSVVDGRVVTNDGLVVNGVAVATNPVKFKVT